MSFHSTKLIELGSCAFRQPSADSHCKYLHGYRLTAKFWFEAKHLDINNWVVDFGGLKDLKKSLRGQFDHTTCISRSDPYVNEFKRLRDAGVCDLRLMDGVGVEKFAEYCYKEADSYIYHLTNGRCRCYKAEVFEHENNSAIYVSNLTYTDDHSDKNEQVVVKKDPVPVVEKGSEKKKTIKDTTTRPPFANKDSLWPVKQKNTWIDNTGTSTWGL